MSAQEEVKSSPNRVKLWIVFVSVYSLGLLGSLSNEWKDAGINKQWTPGFSTFDQLENLFNRIFSLAGFIDVFLFPALASSITITTSFVIFRRISSKLRRSNLKPVLVILFILSTAFVWIILSFLVAAISLSL